VPLRQHLKQPPRSYSNDEAHLPSHQVATHRRQPFLALEQALVQDALGRHHNHRISRLPPPAVRLRPHLLGGKLNKNNQQQHHQQDNKLKTIGVRSPTPMSMFLDI
jgi:hypothetical protein